MSGLFNNAVCFTVFTLLYASVGCDPQDRPADEGKLSNERTTSSENDPTAIATGPTLAGRSAFPEANETITELIPAKRLSDEDQFASPIDPADIPDVVPWQQAGRYVGHEITVEGRIILLGQSGDGNVNFLNFDKDWRDKFYMVVFDDLAKTLDQSVEQTFKGKLLRVQGKVDTHRGRPQIKIESMQQVEFIDE